MELIHSPRDVGLHTISALKHLEHLKISHLKFLGTHDFFLHEEGLLPILKIIGDRLRSLIIEEVCNAGRLEGVVAILRYCPNLKKLVCTYPPTAIDPEDSTHSRMVEDMYADLDEKRKSLTYGALFPKLSYLQIGCVNKRFVRDLEVPVFPPRLMTLILENSPNIEFLR